jgi:hypothetical protein
MITLQTRLVRRGPHGRLRRLGTNGRSLFSWGGIRIAHAMLKKSQYRANAEKFLKE